LLFIGQEFCYYWYHRAAHRVRWFWAAHAVHHSPNELTLAAAFRIGIFGKLTGTALFFVPLVWLGFDVRTVFSVLTLNLLYQFWIHVTWIPRLGWIEYVLNTPSSHRVHHASNTAYLDANFGGVLIVFDRLFGTYVAEREDLPCRYGLVEPQTSYNPLRVEFSPWAHLARDLARARRVATADELAVPGDPEFRSALVGYLEWGSRLAVINSQPGAVADEHAPMPMWSWGEVKGPYTGG
jgi:sterol desaturase/sphingolipid hydroxylase (fatty acid hydroxylase superfamily)